MQVVHVSKVTGIAGSEGHLLRLLPGLMQLDVDVHMIVLEDPRQPATSFCHALETRGVPVETLPISHHIDPRLPDRLTRRFRALGPDIVHTHLIHADFYGLPAASRAGIPVAISSRHNDDAFRHNLFIKWLNHRLMRHAGQIVTISYALERFVIEVEGIDPDRVMTVHYGLEAPESNLQEAGREARARLGYEKEPLVGAFGRLVRQKGFDILLEAFALIRAEHRDARLVIVGDGNQRSSLEAQAQKLGIGDVVQFTGWVEDASTLMPACDMIVVPSRWEGFGLVTLEAMGYARPLIVSRTSALPEIVLDGKNGLHVPPEDVATLAAAISDLLTHPEKRAAFGEAGYRRLMKEFSVEKMVQSMRDVYYKALSAR